MNRIERLLNLIAGLLNAHRPVSVNEIQKWFPDDYDMDKKDAALRKFERDKADLLEMGVPIRFVASDIDLDEYESGYIIDRADFYLPEIEFNQEELLSLFLAGTMVRIQKEFPLAFEMDMALNKIQLISQGIVPDNQNEASRFIIHHPIILDNKNLSEFINLLFQAIYDRKNISITYRAGYSNENTKRVLDPYGLFLRRGVWTCIGFCHFRSWIRSFDVHRILKLKVNTQKPKTPDFSVPEDFNIEDYTSAELWDYENHGSVKIKIWLDKSLLNFAKRHLLKAKIIDEKPDGSFVLEIKVTNIEPLLWLLLSFKKRARVIAPEKAVRKYRQIIKNLIKRYEK